MADSLIIVESPAKVKTISKFLGRGYTVKATMGHIRDLPKSKMGIDIENGFQPNYIPIRGRGKVISELRESIRKAGKVLLATDPDREGEAISWHLTQLFEIDGSKPCRIEFNEITKRAVTAALSNPRAINMDLVYAQQARRILDRLVGYKLSPLLWKKVRKGLSAGRVQSVAVRLICDREREIQGFVREEYWTIDAELAPEDKDTRFRARLIEVAGQKAAIPTGDDAGHIVERLRDAEFTVKDIKKRERRRHPAPPFTTSTMQQDASRRLGFGARKTMALAQQLYEGLEIGGEGSVGLVTYIRTDSVRVAQEAQSEARQFIMEHFGAEHVPEVPPHYRAKATAQEAHEAIRPTSVYRTPEMVKPYLTRDQYGLYRIIWERFVASQMKPAVFDVTTVDVEAGDCLFRATGSQMKFPGFSVVYLEQEDEGQEEQAGQALPELSVNERLVLLEFYPEQHFTEPPPRYTEATLVKALEEKGIGRPSTYAPIIDTIIRRNYVELEDKRFRPTDLGFVVVDLLKEWFPNIVDVEFTARMEEDLDRIAEGNLNWVEVVSNFYAPFDKVVEDALEKVGHVTVPDEVSEEKCPECGRNLVVKYGRFGKFLACPGFPECRYTKPIVREVGVKCPICQAPVVERKTKKGRKFYGCSRYPECEFTTWGTPTEKTCPKCGAFLIKKGKGRNVTYQCVRESCGFVQE
ncbi:MAG TPA: type I DNA topoisomerase [Firmicutes bacterium]|nr:type I DNA topoisomerase [Bacillota bacterium]